MIPYCLIGCLGSLADVLERLASIAAWWPLVDQHKVSPSMASLEVYCRKLMGSKGHGRYILRGPGRRLRRCLECRRCCFARLRAGKSEWAHFCCSSTYRSPCGYRSGIFFVVCSGSSDSASGSHRNADIRTFNGLPHQQRAIPSLLAPYHRISMFFQRRLLYSSLPRSSNSLSRQ